MDGAATQDQELRFASSEAGMSGFVRLVRFTVRPAERAELIEAASSAADPTSIAPGGPGHALLVELEHGEWLSINVTRSRPGLGDDPAWLGLAETILGDEDGALVAVTPAGTREPTMQAKDDAR